MEHIEDVIEAILFSKNNPYLHEILRSKTIQTTAKDILTKHLKKRKNYKNLFPWGGSTDDVSDLVISAVLLLACRKWDIALSPQDLVPNQGMSFTVRTGSSVLKMAEKIDTKILTMPISFQAHLERTCITLGVPPEVEAELMRIDMCGEYHEEDGPYIAACLIMRFMENHPPVSALANTLHLEIGKLETYFKAMVSQGEEEK